MRWWTFVLVVFAKIWYRLNVNFDWSGKRKEKMALGDAVMFGAEIDRLYRKAESGEIGIHFLEGMYEMSNEEYQDHVCLGPYTEPSEIKAHLYFGNIRTWINIERKRIGEARGEAVDEMDREDEILWGVRNEKGEIYIWGVESRSKFEWGVLEADQRRTVDAEADASETVVEERRR